jgi:hypothetical protein
VLIVALLSHSPRIFFEGGIGCSRFRFKGFPTKALEPEVATYSLRLTSPAIMNNACLSTRFLKTVESFHIGYWDNIKKETDQKWGF